MKFLEDNHLLSDTQFGFRSARSTELAVFQQVTSICQGLEQGNKVMGVFLDLAKAFDTVNHCLLIKILASMKLDSKLLKWFWSYLTNRRQVVKINQTLSDELQIHHGVPQGSVLGPVLFLVYINDISSLNLSGQVTCFADDTLILYQAKSNMELQIMFQKDAHILRNYFRSNLLSLNVQKSKVVIFTQKKVGENSLKLYLHSHENDSSCTCLSVKIEEKVRYLGFILDGKLTRAYHIADLSNRLRHVNRLLYFLSEHCTSDHLRNIYHALSESVLTHGIVIWGGAATSLKNPLQVAQNYALKSILGYRKSRDMNTKEIYKAANVRPFFETYKYRASIFAFKHPALFNISMRSGRTRT